MQCADLDCSLPSASTRGELGGYCEPRDFSGIETVHFSIFLRFCFGNSAFSKKSFCNAKVLPDMALSRH
jgi:hypothetical protein